MKSIVCAGLVVVGMAFVMDAKAERSADSFCKAVNEWGDAFERFDGRTRGGKLNRDAVYAALTKMIDMRVEAQRTLDGTHGGFDKRTEARRCIERLDVVIQRYKTLINY